MVCVILWTIAGSCGLFNMGTSSSFGSVPGGRLAGRIVFEGLIVEAVQERQRERVKPELGEGAGLAASMAW